MTLNGLLFVIRIIKLSKCDLRYNGFRNTKNTDKNSLISDSIFLGCECYTFEELFERIELFYDGEWIPFGEKV